MSPYIYIGETKSKINKSLMPTVCPNANCNCITTTMTRHQKKVTVSISSFNHSILSTRHDAKNRGHFGTLGVGDNGNDSS
ncbi:hypothetical protein CEXT_597031 [Caerostris extrusa]|uniref:Uncharacterized protein n=1 Tax=Caerostris extrusa TaxID=172846 RepID=A0AAV4XET1_CAEEX|nr:hypothetical protein CEXT_597031 [Caerostris extrusa]